MIKSLNKKHELFCQEYLKNNFNANKAYVAVYGSKDRNVEDAAAWQLLRNIKIQKRLAFLISEKYKLNNMDIEKAFSLMVKQATYDSKDFFEVSNKEIEKDGKIYVYQGVYLKDWDKIDGTMIQEIKETQQGIQIKLPDRQKALEMIGRHLAMFTDKIQHSGDEDSPIVIVMKSAKEKDG